MGKVNFPYLSRSLPDHPLSGGWWLLDAETNGLHPEEGDELIALRLAYMKKDTILETCEMRIRPELMERMELCCYPRLIDVECAQKLVLAKLEAIAGCHEEDGLPIEPCTGS